MPRTATRCRDMKHFIAVFKKKLESTMSNPNVQRWTTRKSDWTRQLYAELAIIRLSRNWLLCIIMHSKSTFPRNFIRVEQQLDLERLDFRRVYCMEWLFSIFKSDISTYTDSTYSFILLVRYTTSYWIIFNLTTLDNNMASVVVWAWLLLYKAPVGRITAWGVVD